MGEMNTAPVKPKFSSNKAIHVASQMLAELGPVCDRIIVAGSLRRRKTEVGDVEIVYIPKVDTVTDLLGKEESRTSQVDNKLSDLIGLGVIEKRLNINGHEIWGNRNKLARHVASGIPIDFFCADEKNWFSILVCRTGPKESNMAICEAAIDNHWHWSPYLGFWDNEGVLHEPESEEEVFSMVGLKYEEPWNRK